MLDEVLFMEVRLFRMFCTRGGVSTERAYQIFDDNGIWQFIEECYGSLHLSSDECALADIYDILRSKKVEM